MEHVNCNLCGFDDAKVLFRKKDKFRITEDEFSVVECRRCGLAYINPRPDSHEIGRFYPETYSWRESLEADSGLARALRAAEKAYRYHLLKDEVSKVIKFTGKRSGKVLDLGCGTGDRLDVFRNHTWETYGIETSDSADYAKEHMKLDVLKGDLFSARFPDHFFDVVTLYHVLEHTPDPLGVCREIRRVLKEDGFLVIQVPNRESFQYGIFKKRWAAFDVPRDLHYFGTRTLCSLLEKAGFVLMKTDHFMNWWHPPTLVLSLFPSLDPQKAWQKEGKGQTTLFQRVAWILLTLTGGPLTWIESRMRHGAIITAYAVKSS